MKKPYISNTWLVLDCNYLCHRAHYALPTLASLKDEFLSGATFGFLRDLDYLQTEHNTRKLVFCFDEHPLIRKRMFPDYKWRGEDMSDSDRTVERDIARQTRELQFKWLPRIGYKNIFSQRGYEADDIIASVVKAMPNWENAIIVSSDHDFWQLLSHNVMCWNPAKKSMMTEELFRSKYALMPEQWVLVKSVAGCTSDKIPGVRGVGETKAAMWVAGILPNGVCKSNILSSRALWERNMELVRLPLSGVEKFTPKEDTLDRSNWLGVCKELNFPSLMRA